MKVFKLISAILLSFGAIPALCPKAEAQDITSLGGDLSSDLPGRHAIQVTAPNVTDPIRINQQLEGFTVFHGAFTKSTGLGPDFLSASCGGCHVNNGRGPIRFSTNKNVGTTMVVKASLSGLNDDGSPRDVPGIGSQLMDHAVTGLPDTQMTLIWSYITGRYPDGTEYTLRKPNLRVRYRDTRISTRKLRLSIRMSPPVIGPGLLEAVPDSVLEAMSDPDDLDGDGISGVPHYVLSPKTGLAAIGRFGFRASNPTVEEQSAAALISDMGVTNPLFMGNSDTPEVSAEALNELVVYQKIAGVPFARNQSDERVISGKALFQSVGCADCHKMTLNTASYPSDPELENQEFHPFTDLLLHDMGPGLADRRAEFSAKGSEWRTTPLWGLGFARELLSRGRTFLHDGRARSPEEAILWHGGEAAKSRNNFKSLRKRQRQDLLLFLNSL